MVRRVEESTEDDSITESPVKRHKKHKKHKHRRHEKPEETTEVKQEEAADRGIKLKIKIGGETFHSGSSGEHAESTASGLSKKKEKPAPLPGPLKGPLPGPLKGSCPTPKDDVFRTKKSDEDTSDEEKMWLNALEQGTLDDKGMLKKCVDEKLMTTRQRALLHGKQDEPLLQLPSGYKSKEDLSDEQIKKKIQKAKQRRELAQKKQEKDKKQTLDRLLKKQEAKGKGLKSRTHRKHRPPGFRYTLNAKGASISVPEGKNFPFTARTAVTPKQPVLCGVESCSNPKKYACSQTGVPLCSLQCYKANLAQQQAT